MANAVARLEWDQTALLWTMLAEPYRDDKEHPEPYHPADVHPLRTREEYESEEDGEPDWATWHRISQAYPVQEIDLGKLPSHPSRPSVS